MIFFIIFLTILKFLVSHLIIFIFFKTPNLFRLLSITLRDYDWHQTSRSFWAARSYAKLGEYNKINYWLKRASNNPNSFYGMLSLEILGIKDKIKWQTSTKINKYVHY